MVGKLRVHKGDATVERVTRSNNNNNFYVIRIQYARRQRNYMITLYEGTKQMKTFKNFLNVKRLEEVEGKTISYIAANDIDEPSKDGIWMLANEDETRFLDLKTYEVKDKKQVKKQVTKFVFSEF